MAGLIAVLHIPLMLTRGVLRDRQNYQTEAVTSITAVWGGPQRLNGPVLAVPFSYRGNVRRTRLIDGQVTEADEPATCTATAYFLPSDLRVESDISPELRRRGIFDAVVYSGHVKVSGHFQPEVSSLTAEPDRVEWGKARVLFGVTDLHGLRDISGLHGSSGHDTTFESLDTPEAAALTLAAPVSDLGGNHGFDFAFEVGLQGSGTVEFLPLGKQTTAVVRAAWFERSFVGSWLPTEHHVAGDGFVATWSIAQFSRGLPQGWTSRELRLADMMRKADALSFGVRFGRGIDGYAMVERAHKYGILFFAITFAVFFLFEVTAPVRIHPLQYAMVGAALCLFFLGFLALSEFWPIGVAYGSAGALCTALVSLYALTFLRTGQRTLIVAGGLGATYGCLYLVLRSQDYALLAGTAALFATLSLAMWVTRRIDWYALDEERAVPAENPT